MTSFLACRSIALFVLFLSGGLCAAQTQAPAAGVSEKDFFGEMPMVLSVSRLPQRLDETPGAVTILDRDMIRRSGARDMADLLRLVPGFQSSTSFERTAPQASYHGSYGTYSNRMQVQVDGRSVYSPYFIGSTEFGLQAVALEDIERIEVLRGSNSAAYGARAFLGVINIITRAPVDTVGLQGSLTAGQNGVRDGRASVGWRSGDATSRVSVDQRSDAGLLGAGGRDQVSRVNFRSGLYSGGDEIEVHAGSLRVNTGKGTAGIPDDAWRDTAYRSGYAQFDWRRSLAEDQDLALSVSHTQESYQDAYPYSLIPLGINDSIEVSASGRAASDSILLQHTFRLGSVLRMVWGGELRHEAINSRPLYNTDADLVNDFRRLFGNAEWRLRPDLLLNAGAMFEHSSVNGEDVAPRLMLNWRLQEGQTLRAGVSRAFRPPSIFEKYADVRYSWNGQLVALTHLATGQVESERALVRELGYLVDLPQRGLNLDVRVFQESIDSFIRQQNQAVPKDYANSGTLTIQGIEYQLKWRPWQGAQVSFNQAFININSTDIGDALAAPRLASSMVYSQKLPAGVDLSWVFQHRGAMTLPGNGGGDSDRQPATRIDMRLAMPLRFDRQRGELALVLQNLGSSYPDFQANFLFERRAFVTLRLDN